VSASDFLIASNRGSPMDLGISGKTALITAASRGIGFACAEALAREGANVVICAREGTALQEAADQIRRTTGAHVASKPADLASLADIEALVEFAISTFSGVDILVAICGTPPRGSFVEINERQLLQAFETTVLTLFRLIGLVLPHMQSRRWGRIVSVQSRSVKEPVPDLTASNSTRPGAAGLLKDLSQAAARDGVLFNTVLPGRILTDRFKQGAERAGSSQKSYFDSQARELPTGRLGTPQEIADVVAFLASERASYINGVALAVDGGLIRSI
jgi:3-oxoacyl-[acyl-carrier protein] reductase